MKKVRLFAVAAAMGMFASTVAAAEPVVSTGYTTTWEGVEEIIKVDVGNKVVAPVTTIKVVKETRTTDTEYDVTNDSLGFAEDANCLTSTGVATDDDLDNYSDVQIYANVAIRDNQGNVTSFAPGYYTSVEEAVKDYLADRRLVIAPNAEEVRDDQYYAKFANKTFVDYEEVYAWLEEQGLVESVYNEDGDLTKILVNKTQITDYKGRELANARFEITVPEGKREDEYEKENLVNAIATNGNISPLGEYTKLANYTEKTPLTFGAYLDGNHVASKWEDIETGSIVIVDEYKGELNVVDVIHVATGANVAVSSTDSNSPDYYVAGWVTANDGTATTTPIKLEGTEGKVTVYSLENNRTKEVVKLATISETKAAAYTPYSTMVWDEEAGSFIKETDSYVEFASSGKLTDKAGVEIAGFWWGNENDTDKTNDEDVLTTAKLNLNDGNNLGLEKIAANTIVENPSSKYLLKGATVTGVNTKAEKITISYPYKNTTKELTVDAVELDNGVWYPAFDSEETLVAVATKVFANEAGVEFETKDFVEGLDANHGKEGHTCANTLFTTWYDATKALAGKRWSGYVHEEDLPETELMGPGSEACSYVVSVESETVDATVEASEVDTTVAGVKTMTLSAKVDGEVVATKDVKVVVAPRYERTYVNGKVAVLKSFYLDGTLYSEYHYDWAAKTYTATFYANDGVTVASTANGTL